MKTILLITIFIISNYAYCQKKDDGGIVMFFVNSKNERIVIDTINVTSFNQKNKNIRFDTTYFYSDHIYKLLSPGIYIIEIQVKNLPKIVIKNVIIQTDKLTHCK